MTEIEQKVATAKPNLIAKGRANGILSYKEISDALGDVELDPEQIEKIYETLEQEGVEVVADMEKELEKIEEELDEIKPSENMDVAEEVMEISNAEGVSIDDHVKMYLKEIGKVHYFTPTKSRSLLKKWLTAMRQQENALLKRTYVSLYRLPKDMLAVACYSLILFRKVT